MGHPGWQKVWGLESTGAVGSHLLAEGQNEERQLEKSGAPGGEQGKWSGRGVHMGRSNAVSFFLLRVLQSL